MTFFQNLFFSTVFCPSLPLSFSCLATCVLIWERKKKRSGQSEEFLHIPSPPLRPEQREEGERNDMAMNERISWHFLWGCWLEALVKQEVTEKTHDNRMENETRARESRTVNVAKVKKRENIRQTCMP